MSQFHTVNMFADTAVFFMLGLLLVVVSVEACELRPSHLEINIRCHPFTTMVLAADEPMVLIVFIYCSVILK